MAAITFPTSPTLNQEFTANGRTWFWTGSVWGTVPSPGLQGLTGATGETGATGATGPQGPVANIDDLTANTIMSVY